MKSPAPFDFGRRAGTSLHSLSEIPTTPRAPFHPKTARRHHFRPIDYGTIARVALPQMLSLARFLVPGGKVIGNEYLALNPTRFDKRLGSFRLNLRTGRWGDFATGDRGGDFVSFVAYVTGLPQWKAALWLARMLGIEQEVRHG
jgi:hypothetical protein